MAIALPLTHMRMLFILIIGFTGWFKVSTFIFQNQTNLYCTIGVYSISLTQVYSSLLVCRFFFLFCLFHFSLNFLHSQTHTHTQRHLESYHAMQRLHSNQHGGTSSKESSKKLKLGSLRACMGLIGT